MNPLFIAHLAADFLLQTTHMVKWKMRNFMGIIAHSAVHAGVLALFLLPRNLSTIGLILAITVAHGLIDQIKVISQRRINSFGPSFLLDQLAHIAVLAAAAFALQNFPAIWKSETGILIASLVAFLSFGVGTWHLTHIPENRQQRTTKVAIVAFTFFCYLAAAKILA